ncbi:MAG: hypothetical protein ACI8PZ_006669 [Myxococcota bacterium]|jgi:hypothetical protein
MGERAVAVAAQGPDRAGTGVRIGGGHVLTAAHVVRSAQRVCVAIDGEWVDVAVQLSASLDAALLTLPPQIERMPPVALATGSADGRHAEGWGFPRGAHDGGRWPLHPLRGSLDELRYLHGGPADRVLVVGAPPVESADWSGVSGGPVAIGEGLAGLLARVPTQFPGRLTVVPMPALRQDPVLQAALLACPVAGAQVDRGTLRIQVPELELFDRGTAPLVVVQTPPSDAWQEDGPRPAVCEVLRQLLTTGDGIDAFTTAPTLVVLPEYALGGPDLDAVDGMLRAWPYPVVLYAGVGAMRGSDLADWATAGGAVERVLGEDPRPLRRYNLGMLWVRAPGRTVCVAVVKRFAEQKHERTALPDLARGTRHVVVELADVDLHPVICADLVQSVDGDVGEMLHRAVRAERPQVVLAALWQAKPEAPAWHTALRRTVETGAVVIVANVASQTYSDDDAADAWRNLSGVYVDHAHDPDLRPSWPACRALPPHDRLRGVVLRSSEPGMAAGTLALPPYGSTGNARHPWAAFLQATFGSAFAPHQPGLEGVAAAELARVARRFTAHPSLDLPAMAAQLHPADVAVGTLLNGPEGAAWEDIDAGGRTDDLVRGSTALAGLMHATAEVEVEVSRLAQLRWRRRPLGVWQATGWAAGVQQRLEEVAMGGGGLVAIAGAARGRVIRDIVQPTSRTRIDAPNPHARTIDHPDRAGTVLLLPLTELEDLLDPTDETDPGPRVADWLAGELEDG